MPQQNWVDMTMFSFVIFFVALLQISILCTIVFICAIVSCYTKAVCCTRLRSQLYQTALAPLTFSRQDRQIIWSVCINNICLTILFTNNEECDFELDVYVWLYESQFLSLCLWIWVRFGMGCLALVLKLLTPKLNKNKRW